MPVSLRWRLVCRPFCGPLNHVFANRPLPDLSGLLRVVATADSTAWQGAVLQTALKHALMR